MFWCRYIAWILVAALYHLPNFQSMGLDLRMNLSLFLTIYISSILFLVVFHIIFLGLWYVGLVSRVAGRRPEILTILQNCAVSSPLPVLHIKATYLLKILSFVVSYKNYCLHVFHRCRFLAWLAVYFIAIVVIELFWGKNHLEDSIQAGFRSGKENIGTIPGLQNSFVWMSWKTKCVHRGLLQLDLQVIIHCYPNGSSTGRYLFCKLSLWICFICSPFKFFPIPTLLFADCMQRIMSWFSWRNFSYILVVGHIYRSLHCQLCSGEINRVSYLWHNTCQINIAIEDQQYIHMNNFVLTFKWHVYLKVLICCLGGL